MPLQADSTRARPRVDALYFHVPFCFHKCHYCDFYSIVDGEEKGTRQEAGGERETDAHASPTSPPARQSPFLDRLLAELKHRQSQAELKPRTIFVGGGTPTLLAPALWERWLATMREDGLLDEVTEFTVEANPETVSPELMHVLAKGGVNRLSLGAQSFHTDSLKALERWHEPASVGKAMAIAREAGITNLNIDLIFAIPGQTMAMLDADLDAALALKPTHLSYYSLIFEPNTAMTQRLKMGQVQQADEELERAMYASVIDRLDHAGFEHYEVSNWALKENEKEIEKKNEKEIGKEEPTPKAHPLPWVGSYRCHHNLLYWQNANWLGLGPAAASHIDGHRWKNEPHLGRYLSLTPEPPTLDHEHLPADQSVGEQLMLRLRLREGVPLNWVDAHVPHNHPRRAAINEMLHLQMLEQTPTHLRLTREGLFIADAVLSKLL